MGVRTRCVVPAEMYVVVPNDIVRVAGETDFARKNGSYDRRERFHGVVENDQRRKR